MPTIVRSFAYWEVCGSRGGLKSDSGSDFISGGIRKRTTESGLVVAARDVVSVTVISMTVAISLITSTRRMKPQ